MDGRTDGRTDRQTDRHIEQEGHTKPFNTANAVLKARERLPGKKLQIHRTDALILLFQVLILSVMLVVPTGFKINRFDRQTISNSPL